MSHEHDDRVVFAGMDGIEGEDRSSMSGPDQAEIEAFELAAAELEVAFGPAEYGPMPADLRARMERVASAFASGGADAVASGEQPVAGRISPESVRASSTGSASVGTGTGGVPAWSGWMAAAACLALAGLAWFNGTAATSPLGGTQQVSEMAELVSPAEARERLLNSGRDLVIKQWNPWSLNDEGPEVGGVTGDVIWDEQSQTGFMRFSNLPTNAETGEVYQLWIIDERGLADETGQSARISGGVFEIRPEDIDPATGEVIVPIDAALEVKNAAHFAVTIEENGGTWVSDMSRRVVATL